MRDCTQSMQSCFFFLCVCTVRYCASHTTHMLVCWLWFSVVYKIRQVVWVHKQFLLLCFSCLFMCIFVYVCMFFLGVCVCAILYMCGVYACVCTCMRTCVCVR